MIRNIYGFKREFCTHHAILDIVSSIQSNIDQKLFSCAIFIDLKKAFNTVDHDNLIGKLFHYGFRGIISEWIKSYLKGQSQTTPIGYSVSNKD